MPDINYLSNNLKNDDNISLKMMKLPTHSNNVPTTAISLTTTTSSTTTIVTRRQRNFDAVNGDLFKHQERIQLHKAD